ncbi:MAG: amidohydrolase [Cyanobacteria bacterium P01_F01_bin.86]
MVKFQGFDRRDFLKWALATGFSTALLNKGSAWTQNPADGTASLILHNGRIATQDGQQSFAEAVAIKDNRFLAVGSEKEIMAYQGEQTKLINLNGRTVIPGLNDTHTHLIRGGLNYNMELRWDGIPSLADALRMLKEQAIRTPAPQWVRVIGGWSEFQFAERRMPTLAEVNAVSQDVPVFILNLYNRALLNRAALRALGIDRNTIPPAGSIIEKDSQGNPTGMLIAKPNATILYGAIAQGPKLGLDDQLNSSRHYMREMNRLGITGVIDAGGGGQNFPDDYQIIQKLHDDNLLTVRVSYNLFTQNPGEEKADFERWIDIANPGQGDDFYRLNGAGEMLVFSAADFEDFTEPRPDLAAGMESQLTEVIQLLAENNWPFRLHATYDESITRFLNIFEQVNRDVPFEGMHWILDHAETISDRNIERVKALGGGIAIQHRMAYQGEYFVQRYGFDAAKHTPPIKKILAADVPLAAGTDGTRVASYNPWVGLYWLVSGKTVGGTALYAENNRLDRMDALRLYTAATSWFSNQEGNKGAIVPGQLADLAVLSEDYFAVPEERIKHLESVLTIVDGKPVYGSAEFSNFSPPPLPVSPNWSPVGYYGGYHNDSGIVYTGLPYATSGMRTDKPSLWQSQSQRHAPKLSSLNKLGSVSHFWGGLACACC